jgi:hypothetical protein
MSIRENIQNKIKEQEDDKTGRVTSELREQSLAAILGGLGSDAWETYMKNFVDADNPKQLARLMGEDEAAGDPYMRKEIAYLVANASCGSITRTKLDQGLSENLLDKGL